MAEHALISSIFCKNIHFPIKQAQKREFWPIQTENIGVLLTPTPWIFNEFSLLNCIKAHKESAIN